MLHQGTKTSRRLRTKPRQLRRPVRAAIGRQLCGAACGVLGGAAGAGLYEAWPEDTYRERDVLHEGGGRDGAYGDDMEGGEAAGDGVTGGDMGY
jgi:hypothetical protein